MITARSSSSRFGWLTLACAALVFGAAAVSGIGVLSRGPGLLPTVVSTTIRGESVEWVTSGPYAFNAVRTVAEGVGWDWVTLVVAVPALVACLGPVLRGSVGGRLAASGIVAYLFYQYLQYALVWALGPLFPAYVILFPGALWTLVGLVASLVPDLTNRPWPPRYPRVGISVLCGILALVLVVMWSARIAQGLAGNVQGLLYGQTTLGVQALDLGLVVPLAVWVAVQTLRRRPVALVFGPVLLGKAVFMAGAIVAMLLSAWVAEGRFEALPAGIFASAGLASGVLGFRVLRS
ncbi:MAG TPA: hypothetical protein VMB23_06340, partial [Spirochaetia bacterium]|nr:hypothetical protein [Spirochaetia bacterium]